MDKCAVIVAGGSGTRMSSAVPKQFMTLRGKPVIWHTVNVFLQTFPGIRIILVVPLDHLSTAKDILAEYFRDENIEIVTGGITRFDSVKNGLSVIQSESIVFVHDAVRCLVTASLLSRCYETAVTHGSAVPVIRSRDSIRVLNTSGSTVANRDNIRMVQTPQVFVSSILIPAFNREFQSSFTDEATVVEAAGNQVSFVEGEESNIKITSPVDLIIAEAILGK